LEYQLTVKPFQAQQVSSGQVTIARACVILEAMFNSFFVRVLRNLQQHLVGQCGGKKKYGYKKTKSAPIWQCNVCINFQQRQIRSLSDISL